MGNEVLVTLEEAARLLQCSTSTIRRLVKQGFLVKVYLTPGLRRGGCPRITQHSIDQYLETLCHQNYSRQCTGASAASRSSVWQKSTNGRTRRITGAHGSDQTAQELGKKLGVL